MKFLSSIVVLSAVMALTACGGGSGGNSGTGGNGSNATGNQLSVVKINDSPQIIDYHGDSTVFGWQTFSNGDQVATPAPAAFSARLPSYHTVRNMGRSGTTACDLLNGTNGYEQEWAARMKESDATVVIINHAINDMNAYDRARYRSCLNDLVDIARGEGKIVILETPNPAEDDSNGERLAGYVTDMRTIASQKGVNVIDQYAHLRQPAWGGTDPRAVCPDGLHPSQEIYIEKGRFAAERFRTFDAPAAS